MAKGMAYVMLGRCEILNDIHIAGNFKTEGISASNVALEETQNLAKIYNERCAEESKDREMFTKVSFLNVSSALKHALDIQKDAEILDSDIIGLGETWLVGNQKITLDGFQSCFANVRNGQGTASFFKSDLFATTSHFTSDLFTAICVRSSKLDVIFLYLSQNFPKEEVFSLIEDWVTADKKTAILGDLNWNFDEDKKHPMKDFMTAQGFSQLVKDATHEHGNILDQIYVNKPLLMDGCYVTKHSVYYSDHDLISLFVKKVK